MKFKVGDTIINKNIYPPISREIKHVYGGQAINSDMITISFYMFVDDTFSQCLDIDKKYTLSLKGVLKRL